MPLDFILAGKVLLSSPLYVKGFYFVPGTCERRIGVTEGDNENFFPDIWALRQVDLSLTKNFQLPFVTSATRIWARVDVLNVFNTKNYVNYFSNPLNANFGDISNNGIGGNPPRTFKLSTGFSF